MLPIHSAIPSRSRIVRRGALLAAFAGALAASARDARAQTTFQGAGANAADAGLTNAVNAFRTALGGLNPNVAGSFGAGRREVNWDGVPAAFSSPSAFPGNFFNVNSPRGVEFSTPGTGLQNSGLDPVAPRFGNIDPSYAQTFQTFSPQKLFTAVGSNIVDVRFFVPGSSTAAVTRGFGSIFSDVDLAGATTISYFGVNDALLGTFQVTPFNTGLSFLGVLFDAPVVSRVRITNGNTALAPGVVDGGAVDLVVMDDFIYGEPLSAAVVPEPSSFALAGAGLAAIAWAGAARRRARRRAA